MRRKKGSGSFRAQQDAVFDLILLNKVSEDAVCENIKEMFFNDMIYVRRAGCWPEKRCWELRAGDPRSERRGEKKKEKQSVPRGVNVHHQTPLSIAIPPLCSPVFHCRSQRLSQHKHSRKSLPRPSSTRPNKRRNGRREKEPVVQEPLPQRGRPRAASLRSLLLPGRGGAATGAPCFPHNRGGRCRRR